MNATTHPAVQDYLRAVERALDGVPRERRDEIVADLREHIDAVLADGAGETDVKNVIERLGTPADIAAEARERFGITGKAPRRFMEVSAVLLLTIGSVLLPFVGWTVGIVLVYMSNVWNAREKVLATVLFPFGMLPAIFALTTPVQSRFCASTDGGPPACDPVTGPSMVRIVVFTTIILLSAIGPLVTAFVLGRALRREA